MTSWNCFWFSIQTNLFCSLFQGIMKGIVKRYLFKLQRDKENDEVNEGRHGHFCIIKNTCDFVDLNSITDRNHFLQNCLFVLKLKKWPKWPTFDSSSIEVTSYLNKYVFLSTPKNQFPSYKEWYTILIFYNCLLNKYGR